MYNHRKISGSKIVHDNILMRGSEKRSLSMRVRFKDVDFILTNVHAPFASVSNNESVKQLLYTFDSSLPHLMGGDFNCPHELLQTGDTLDNAGTCIIQSSGRIANYGKFKYDGFITTDSIQVQIKPSRAFFVQPNGTAITKT